MGHLPNLIIDLALIAVMSPPGLLFLITIIDVYVANL